MKVRTIAGVATAALLSSVAVPLTNNTSFTKQAQVHKVSAEQVPQSSFLSVAVPYAQQAAKYYGVYPSVMLAQAIVESGWGQSTLATEANNLFGMKGSYNGNSYTVNTREEDQNGTSYYIDAAFRAYPSWSTSFSDNGYKLRTGTSDQPSRYSGTWLENCTAYQDSTAGLVAGGYATSHTYASTLNGVISANGLTQYDPQISNNTKSVVISKTSSVYDSPADPSFAKQVSTVSAGQNVTVDKTIKYADGTTKAHINSGWVDGSAVNGSSSQAPAGNKPAANTGTPVATVKSSAALVDTPNGKTIKNLPAKSAWKIEGKATVNGTTWYNLGGNQWVSGNAVTLSGSSNIKTIKVATVSSQSSSNTGTPVATVKSSAALVDTPNGKTIKHLSAKSAWKIEGKATVNGTTWYNLGGNQWVSGNDVTISGSNNIKTIKVDVPSKQTSSNTGTPIATVKGSAALVDTPNGKTIKNLPAKSAWKIEGKATVNGTTWYNLGGNQWVSGNAVTLSGSNNIRTIEVKNSSNQNTTSLNDGSINAVGKVDYVKGYGIMIWGSPAYEKPLNKYLPTDSEWKMFKKTTVNGQVWYNLGGNQWILGKYIKIVK